MDIHKQLRKRFVRAIDKIFEKRPLIGPKWFSFNADGKSAHFQFLGIGKLAKAAGKNPKHMAKIIVRNLDLRGLKAKAEITSDAIINVKINQPVGKDESASSS